MRKAFLKKARDALLAQKQQIHKQLDEEFREGRESNVDEGMDTYDLASEERTREINLILSDRDRDKLQAIEDALERIEEGSYGICEMCEEEIADDPRRRLTGAPCSRGMRGNGAASKQPRIRTKDFRRQDRQGSLCDAPDLRHRDDGVSLLFQVHPDRRHTGG